METHTLGPCFYAQQLMPPQANLLSFYHNGNTPTMDLESLCGESKGKEELFITQGICDSSLFSCSWQICSSLCRGQQNSYEGLVLFYFLISFPLSLAAVFPPDIQTIKNTKSPPLQPKRKRKANVTLKHYCKHKESIILCHGYNLE